MERQQASDEVFMRADIAKSQAAMTLSLLPLIPSFTPSWSSRSNDQIFSHYEPRLGTSTGTYTFIAMKS